MSVSDAPNDTMSTSSLTVSFVPRPDAFCAICGHAIPLGVDTCTTCLADYGLPMPGVA